MSEVGGKGGLVEMQRIPTGGDRDWRLEGSLICIKKTWSGEAMTLRDPEETWGFC